ncbi:VOC family protein [Nocardioides okcheonensis]|uniref:VOC family protein n=1 Tax=Nocardioides okcheonensis TaxID=2894081 RepID=UPI001E33D95B|nr:VOC family protein [Nocardioides okcheonensis]UFN44425.1 VOC family protein [Nocardioides okcheonensis]
MPVNFQLTVDCADPDLLARFWAAALDYVLAPPPDGHESWDAFYRSVGVPEEELGGGNDRIVDPRGEGPMLWFQVVPETKQVKNRFHLDVNASGGRSHPLDVRRERIDAAVDRLVDLGATRVRTSFDGEADHYAVAMLDPEGNEFDVF